MVHGLTAFFAGVHYDAVAVVEVLRAGDLGRCPQQMTQESAIILIDIGHGAYVAAGDDEDVDRRHGIKVGEGVTKLILINRGGGNDSFNDLAEEAAHSESSLHARSCLGNGVNHNKRSSRICWFHFEPRPL
jgi:hypothetical protein